MKLDRYMTGASLLCVIFMLSGCPDPGVPDIGVPDITDIIDSDPIVDSDDELDGDDVNNPPNLSAWAVSGNLIVGRECSFVVQCQAVDPDGDDITVEMDLSELGGSSSQQMSKFSDDTYMWNGTITPTSSGDKTITIRATDSKGADDEASFLHTVQTG